MLVLSLIVLFSLACTALHVLGFIAALRQMGSLSQALKAVKHSLSLSVPLSSQIAVYNYEQLQPEGFWWCSG